MIYITGDTHRDFTRLYHNEFSKDDVLIILGDACINFYLDERDYELKKKINNLGLKLFCIRGNHEERPENIKSYEETSMFNGKVYIEKEFPNLIFAKDGEEYLINGMKVLVIGGAYSIDKDFRVTHGYEWFKDEQLSDDEKAIIYNKIKGKSYDIVLTHTCPKKYEPKEMFLAGVDEMLVDKSMEMFLDKVEENISYDKWYCGHYHTDKKIDKIQFMFKDIEEFTKELKGNKVKRNG